MTWSSNNRDRLLYIASIIFLFAASSIIIELFNEASYHIERNANPKILFTDLVIRLTKMIKKGV